MKNIIAILCLLIAGVPVFAQISKGTSTIGGSISLTHQKSDYTIDPRYSNGPAEYKETSLIISPGYGYFITNNFCIGANLAASFSKGTDIVTGPDLHHKDRSFGIGPFLRYYIPLDSKLYVYAATSATRLWTRSTSEQSGTNGIFTSSEKNKSLAWDMGIGVSYFINPNAAVETGLAYRHDNGDDTSTLALNIGFRIFLRKA